MVFQQGCRHKRSHFWLAYCFSFIFNQKRAQDTQSTSVNYSKEPLELLSGQHRRPVFALVSSHTGASACQYTYRHEWLDRFMN